MESTNKKALAAANNQGAIVKTSKLNYRTVRLNFQPDLDVFTAIFKEFNNGGVNHASC